MSEPMIRLTDVTKTFPGAVAPAVGSLSMDIAEGEIVMLVGPSGCGKTTTLKMINRLIEPTSGSIKVAGEEVTELAPHELRRGIGYVIQQIGLFPHKTIAQNICVVPELLGWDKERIGRRVEELVELVDLDPAMVDRYPPELSGGQRQRVGVARALAADPPVLLMDEPFGAVDPIVRARLQAELLDLQERVRKTIVFVTHDIDEAIQLGDRVAILNVGGKLEQYAPPAEVLRDPANEFVADFLGSDRGIKRLSLIPISETELEDGPVVLTTDSVLRAQDVMDRYDIDWFIVKEGDRVTGWASRQDLEQAGSVAGLTSRPFQTRLTPASSMEEALDAIVSSHTRIAAVFDGERYEGIVTLDRVNEAVVS